MWTDGGGYRWSCPGGRKVGNGVGWVEGSSVFDGGSGLGSFMVKSMRLETSAGGLNGPERLWAGSGELFDDCGGHHCERLE